MNKAFEKILDRLDTKKLYFQKFYETEGKTEDDENINKATQLAFDDAKSIVKEVAEEYNDDWIPCNERLPEENQKVILQDFYGNITIETMKINNGTNGFSDGNWWSSANNYIAWQPLPEPYKERD